MFGFINHINDEQKLKEQIKKQTKLGFWGYYLKKMFNNGMTYHKGENVKEKKALQIITPQQSLFALVRDNYEDVCFTLLRTIYDGKMPDNHVNLTSGLKDVVACMNLGNIYVTERDTDISMGDKSAFTRLFTRLFPVPFELNKRQFDIYIPPYINNNQNEELLKTMRNRKDFESYFKREDIINIYHCISKDDIQHISGNEALEYLAKEKPDWVKDDIPVNPDEKILVDTYRTATSTVQRQNAPFVERVDIEAVAVANSDLKDTEQPEELLYGKDSRSE